jgi:hypothetical protein
VSSEIAAWLRVQAQADIKAAKAATPGPWANSEPGPWIDASSAGIIVQTRVGEDAAHIARHDPLTEEAQAESVLAILDEHEEIGRNSRGGPICNVCVNIGIESANDAEFYATYPCRTVRLLAYGYRYRPGYVQEWKP